MIHATRLPIVLASGSSIRAKLLENAGIAFRVEPANIDEREAEAPLAGADFSSDDVATMLALAKANKVSARNSGAIVIGADQILTFHRMRMNKPVDMAAARRQLLALSGEQHELHTSVVMVRDGETIWQTTQSAYLKMRKLSPPFIGRYLARVGETALESVGGYQVEGYGINLLESIEGDYFAVLGLPLLPLLGALRNVAAIDG